MVELKSGNIRHHSLLVGIATQVKKQIPTNIKFIWKIKVNFTFYFFKNIITFLQPLKDKYEQALAYYQGKGLTRRETEVVSLTIRGVTNIDICQSLSISKATLRTHLNNIYRKLRELGEEPAFIPANRVSV